MRDSGKRQWPGPKAKNEKEMSELERHISTLQVS